MRSPRGILGAAVFLSLLPAAVVYQMFFESGVEIVIHLILAAGSIFMSLAIFDFKTARWINLVGSFSMGALAIIFLLQALGPAVQNDSLTWLAFQILGQGLERGLGLLFIFWCLVMLLTDSRGKARIFGFIVMSAVVFLQVYTYGPYYLSGTAAEELKLIFLLMFAWLLLESAKKSRGKHKSTLKSNPKFRANTIIHSDTGKLF